MNKTLTIGSKIRKKSTGEIGVVYLIDTLTFIDTHERYGRIFRATEEGDEQGDIVTVYWANFTGENGERYAKFSEISDIDIIQ